MARDPSGPSAPDLAALAEIGERLRSRRLELGLELTDVEASTKVRIRYLEALESGEFSILPGGVYAVGFVRAAADFLGLDSGALARQYAAALEKGPAAERPMPVESGLVQEEPPAGPPPVEKVREPLPRRTESRLRLGREVEERVTTGVRPGGRRAGTRPFPAVAVVIIVVLALAVAAYVGYSALHLSEDPPGQAEPGGTTPGGTTPGGTTPSVEPGGTEPGGTSPGGSAGSGTPEGFTLENVVTRTGDDGRLEVIVNWDTLTVELTFLERVWLHVECDRELVHEGTQEGGTSLSFAAKDRIYVRVGRAVHTELAVFGLGLGPTGAGDEPRNVVLTRKQ